MPYYAVVRGRRPGIFVSGETARKQAHKFPNALWKLFKTFEDARLFYEKEGGDLSKLPNYVGYKDATEKVIDLEKPEVEEDSENDEDEDKDKGEEEEEEDSETEDLMDLNLRGISDEEEDEISISMKQLDERPSSVLSNGRSKPLGKVDPNDPDTDTDSSNYSEDGADGQRSLFERHFGETTTTKGTNIDGPCQLHEDIERFVADNVQTKAETSLKNEIEDQVRKTIQKFSFPEAEVHRFGSGATGLALKDADIDLVILGVGPQSVKGGGGGFTRFVH